MFSAPTLSSASLVAMILFLAFIPWRRYNTKQSEFTNSQTHQPGQPTAPATFPYVFPFLGSLPLAYLINPLSYVLDVQSFFQCPNPTRVKILNKEFYVLHRQENVRALFRGSSQCTSIPLVQFALGNAFGLPAAALRTVSSDDSGGGPVPHPDSNVEARNRFEYRDHHSFGPLLEGTGLVSLVERFQKCISDVLGDWAEEIGDEGRECDDLMRVLGDKSTAAIVDALCGTYLRELNPTFLDDFWEFDRCLQTYLQGIPWFLAPRAYAARTRVLNAVKKWQAHAREHYTPAAETKDGDDPYWGTSFFRKRHDTFLEMDGFDYDAIASADFGAIWAVRNAVSAVSWAIFDIYTRPSLLATICTEVSACRAEDGKFDIDKLLHLPVLQAVYAETLRLRMHFYIIRMPDRVDMRIRNWIIPRRKVVVTPTTVAHMDTQTWDTGLNNEHPVNEFWEGRFLKASTDGEPVFSTKDLEGSWIPYGGGPRQCPGRHFAKRQILLTITMVIAMFDVEILGRGKEVKEDFTLNGFGGGMSRALGKVPVRIRRSSMGGINV
ncbi:cytochrome P450 [Xylariaceae sp. FL1019]|nr:cytochrome P450 [Xylariaceae sp. FL1019]